ILNSNTLMKNKKISLENWLENPTKQGLPFDDVKDGNLFYWGPKTNNNSTMWFYTSFNKTGLSCNWSPFSFGKNFGVRRVIKKV
ncbi:MAG: hypothetical protein AABX80_02785, partial [Nanoarchaeota archaeon]